MDSVKGYMKARKVLLQKLPLDGSTLQAFTFLNPDKKDKSGAATCLSRLGELLSHLLMDEDRISFDEEIGSLVSSDCIPKQGNDRVDVWWGKARAMPTLSDIAKAGLSIFHGLKLEGSLSLIKDVTSKKSGSMSVATFSSIQTVKYFLKAKGRTATQHFQRPSINHTPVCKHLVEKHAVIHKNVQC
ncbi:hypothetical protein ElyMa_000139500 [Elysia marginata]|uniref:HAT C-terminal dimerisation domain-containing protein n=1 Tax=Elysia marginata TaxID=1093978 RepID=A0AAV4ENU1_9GAST|nr:hypothetical protein ElyMa_000139500 [Elysia marginata]